MFDLTVCCEPCAHAGVNTLAEYVYEPEETSLRGPLLGDPDCWPPHVEGHRAVCQTHYVALSPDSRVDYFHVQGTRGPSKNTEGTRL